MLNVILFIVAWMFRSKWFKIKVHIDKRNSNTSSILIKVIMSSQNNMAKESSSLQNHIVRLCFIFVTQKCSQILHPLWQASQLFRTSIISNFFNFHAIHEREPWIYHYGWNRIWWWGLCGEDKKGESLTLTRIINGLWRCPSIDVNMRSRDYHATDALEL